MALGASAQQQSFLFSRHILTRTRIIYLLLAQMWHRPCHRAPTAPHILVLLPRSWFLIIVKRIVPGNSLALNGPLCCIISLIVIRGVVQFGKINHILTFVLPIKFITMIWGLLDVLTLYRMLLGTFSRRSRRVEAMSCSRGLVSVLVCLSGTSFLSKAINSRMVTRLLFAILINSNTIVL